MSANNTSRKRAASGTAKQREPDQRVRFATEDVSEGVGEGQPIARSWSDVLVGTRDDSLTGMSWRACVLLGILTLSAFNVWIFHEDLAAMSMGLQRTSQYVFARFTLTSAAFPYKFHSASKDCNKCDVLSPTMKHAILEYVQFLLAHGGHSVAGASSLPMEPQRDYALRADGGSIVCELTSGCSWWVANIPGLSSTAEYAIDDSHAIGHCWLLSASHGQLGILLAEPLLPTSLTVDHIPQSLAADVGQAPRSMIMWGLIDGEQNEARFSQLSLDEILPSGRSGPPIAANYRFAPLAVFEYDVTASYHVQTFPILPAILNSGIDFTVVVLELVDNWGSATTCLYRVRVHGSRASS